MNSTATFRTSNRELVCGGKPLIVGVLCSLASKFPPRGKAACDLVEVRLDITGRPDGWLDRCKAIERLGWPVLLTLRLKSEGGQWSAPDDARLPILREAIASLAAVDIELRSPIAATVARLARRHRKVCVVSYHDFQKTPSAAKIEAIIRKAEPLASIVKIATKLSSERDADTLRSLLARKWKKPLCLIGMGPDWAHTRSEFPALGSCLTYGYLDKPTAPGQTSAADLTRRLK